MATITYKCDICDRNIDLLENPIGLTTFSKCVITYGCKGKLLSVKRNQDNIRETFPAEVPGLIDYSPRNVLSNFNQTVPLTTWIINHNLNTNPAVTVYVDNNVGSKSLLDINEYKIVTVNANQLKLVFSGAYSGTAQLISRNSIKSDPTTVKVSTSLTQVTSNGTFVFAIPKYLTKFIYPPTILPPPELPYDLSSIKLRIEVSIQKPNEEATICSEFINAELTGTSWNGWNSILVRKRKNYYLFSINILDFRTFGGDTTKFGDIPNGTQMKITRVDYGTGVLQPIDTEGLFIMLSNSPYTINDKIKNLLVDVGDMVNNDINYFTYSGSNFFVDSSNVDKTYPDVSKVNPVIPVIAPLPSVTPTVTPTITPTSSITPTPTPVIPTNNNLYVGGSYFLVPDAVPMSGINRLNTDGTFDNSFIDLGISDNRQPFSIMESLDNKIYIGGRFGINGESYTDLIRLNPDGTLDSSLPNYELDDITCSIIQTIDTKIYVGGFFTNFTDGTNNYQHLARLNSDGTLDTTFADLNISDNVSLLYKTVDGKIYLQGTFGSLGGYPYTFFARLNSDGTLDTTFVALPFTNTLHGMIQTVDGKIYLSTGQANYAGAYSYLIRLNSDGTLDTTFIDIGLNNIPTTFMQTSDGKIYVGGSFTSSTSGEHDHLVRLNSDGTLDNTYVNLQFNSNVNGICQNMSGEIYVGGNFDIINSTPYIGLARLNSDGTLDNTFENQYLDNSYIQVVMNTSTNNIYYGGSFMYYNYIPKNSALSRINSSGEIDNAYDIIPMASVNDYEAVYSFIKFNDKIYVGGQYTNIESSSQLMRLNSNGIIDSTFVPIDITYGNEPISPGGISALCSTIDNKLYCGGYFDSINSNIYNGVFRLNSDGSVDYSYTDLNINNNVNSVIQTIDGKIYVAGGFTSINGAACNYLARLNSDGTFDTTFINLAFDSDIAQIYQNDDGKIYVLGNFLLIGVDSHQHIARLNSDGTVDNTFIAPTFDAEGFELYYITSISGKLYLSGNFLTVNDNSYSHLVRLNYDGTLDTTFTSIDFDDGISIIYQTPDNKIYVGGQFYQIGSIVYNGFARLNSDGTLDTTFISIPYINSSIYALLEP